MKRNLSRASGASRGSRWNRGAADLVGLLLVVLLLAAAGTGGYAYWIWGEAQTLERKLAQAEKDLKTCINIRDDLRDIKLSGQSAADQDMNTIQTFFHDTAKDHKFTITRVTPSTGNWRGTWEEKSFRLEIKGVTRQQLGNFVAEVQQKRPFLKAKEIRDIRFDEVHNITTVAVIFSHYTRLKK